MRPAIQEKRFEYKGFPCVVEMQIMAFRTGYVGLPKGHKYYGVDYRDITSIDCHGGLSYSDSNIISNLVDQIEEDYWWIGFDTAHGDDGFDYETAIKLFREEPDTIEIIQKVQSKKSDVVFEEPRSLEYCESECRKIVDQLLSMEE